MHFILELKFEAAGNQRLQGEITYLNYDHQNNAQARTLVRGFKKHLNATSIQSNE
jgi:hypothetical protein